MGRHLLSPRAQEDLEEIWDFSAQSWGEERADSYLRGIWIAIRTVADDPRRGHACGFRPGLFQYSVGRQVLFFKPIVDGVDVIRILHQGRDFQRHV